MPGVIGANANLYIKPETTYGTLATGNYTRLGFLRAGLGVSQQLLDVRVLGLGQGRDPGDPILGEIDTEGEVEIPINQDGLGHWLRLLFGAPTTSGTSPDFVHVFTSGAASLPSVSLSLDYGSVLTDRYLVLTGVRAGSISIGFGPTGPATARLGLMAQGGGLQATAVHGSPTTATGENFNRAQGRILKDATPLALITDATLDISNGIEPLRTIRSDRKIEEAEPGGTSVTGRITARFTSGGLLADALADTPVDITLGFRKTTTREIAFNIPRAFLSKPRAEVDGPGGVAVTYDFRASADGGPSLTATLRNGVASYA
jgi:hypothetical protein